VTVTFELKACTSVDKVSDGAISIVKKFNPLGAYNLKAADLFQTPLSSMLNPNAMFSIDIPFVQSSSL
jgi:hypothetical protein